MKQMLQNMPEKILKLKFPKTGDSSSETADQSDFERKLVQGFEVP